MIEQHYDNVCYLQFKHYQQFPSLIHGVFTRQGGISEAPYASLNTSSPPQGGGDTVANVMHNRQLVLEALGLAHKPSVTLWQIHGADVVTLDLADEWRTDWASESYYTQRWSPTAIRKGDALLSQERDVVMALSFADCVPLTFYDPVQQVIALAHGGWRGTARGISLATIAAMQERFHCQPADIYAGIAPAIGPCCYEVSEGVRDVFLGYADFPDTPILPDYRGHVRESAVFSTVKLADGDSLRLDLQHTNQNQLLMAGLLPEHIEIMPICTSCRTDLFFSHRKEQGRTGRFVVVMALKWNP